MGFETRAPMKWFRQAKAVLSLLSAAASLAASLAAHGAASGAEVVADAQSAASARAFPDGRALVDFGCDAFGWAELDLPAGEYIVRLGEKLGADGMIDMKPGGTIRAAEVAFVSRGAGFERVPLVADGKNTAGVNRRSRAVAVPAKFGVVMPFRYMEVCARDGAPAADSVAAKARRQVLHWPVDMTASSFVCGDEALSQVYDFCKYSIWATSFAGVYVDGDRERIPYEADAYLNQLGHYSVDADFEMARRTFEYLADHPTWPTEWAQHMIMMAWADWMYSGSTNLVARYYPLLKNEKLLLGLAREDCLLVSFPDHSRADQGDIVDWPVAERDGFVFKPVNAVVNAFHYRNLREMRDMAGALGRADDAAMFEARAVKVKESFDRVFYRPATGLYADGEGTDHSSLHANAAALAFGLVPRERVAHVADFLVSKGMACSVYFAQYLLEALFEGGRGEDAVRLMTSSSNRSWLGMMAQGSTITTEAWSLEAKPNQDWNHAWATAPLNVITRHVLGVKPTSPGFATYEVKPFRASFAFGGTVPTVRGPVRSEYDPADGVRVYGP